MEWNEICENPAFKDMPFKVETNEWGKIMMTPASNEHGIYQFAIIKLLIKLGRDGEGISECSVKTSLGVKVADVAWGSYDFFRNNKSSNPYLKSPEIMIEILSPSNTLKEMQEKKELYFARGAKEFWVCEENGTMRFYNCINEISTSEIMPDFPNKIDISFAD